MRQVATRPRPVTGYGKRRRVNPLNRSQGSLSPQFAFAPAVFEVWNMSRARKCVYPATRRVPRQCHVSHRRGVVSVLAMLYLIIFATLALGFYTAVTTSAQLANNDERAMGAQIAAESG